MKKNIIEVVTFQTKNNVSEEQLLKLSHAFGEALRREVDGFIKRTLTKHCTQDTWVELVWWDSMESAEVALEKVLQIKEFEQYNNILEEDGSEIFYVEEKQ